jgi:hypothetical protein
MAFITAYYRRPAAGHILLADLTGYYNPHVKTVEVARSIHHFLSTNRTQNASYNVTFKTIELASAAQAINPFTETRNGEIIYSSIDDWCEFFRVPGTNEQHSITLHAECSDLNLNKEYQQFSVYSDTKHLETRVKQFRNYEGYLERNPQARDITDLILANTTLKALTPAQSRAQFPGGFDRRGIRQALHEAENDLLAAHAALYRVAHEFFTGPINKREKRTETAVVPLIGPSEPTKPQYTEKEIAYMRDVPPLTPQELAMHISPRTRRMILQESVGKH